MARTFHFIFILSVSLAIALPVWGQDPIVFPAKDQSQEQMEMDKFRCYTWAKNETGFSIGFGLFFG